ncbi:hypothetical protein TNCV_4383691 [Trichonephila clavipes]|nr:hypothetical protein TNCV_4383691 [Trichonephila clavipes]
MVSLSLAFCTQGCGFDPGPSRWIFMMQKIDSGLRRMIIRHEKDPLSVRLAWMLSAKLNSLQISHRQSSALCGRNLASTFLR